MAGRSRASRPALLGSLLFALVSCTTAPASKPARGVAAELLPFLTDPTPFGLGSASPEALDLYRRLLGGEDPVALSARAREIAARPGAAPGARVLLAEAELVAGRSGEARDAIAALPLAVREATPVRLLEARAAEGAGDWIGAAEGYRGAAGESATARSRLAAVDGRATAALRERIESAIAERRFDEALVDADRLALWHPGSEAALEATWRAARGAGNVTRELSAVRALAAAHPDRVDLTRRRGVLEVEAGDAALGVGLLQGLADRAPGDAGIAAELQRAKFLFRLSNAPEEVRHAARSPQLTRAEFARLLYWLVPEVRTARGGVARIATDILDDPARDEIVRVANLGLLEVDETLHLFEPGRALRRTEAFRALGRIAGERPAGSCASAARQAELSPCALAVECGWIPEPAACLPLGPVTGAEATEWIREAAEPAEVKS